MLTALDPNVPSQSSSPYKKLAVPGRIKLKADKHKADKVKQCQTPHLFYAPSEGSSSTLPTSSPCTALALTTSSPCVNIQQRSEQQQQPRRRAPSKFVLQPHARVLFGRKTPSLATLAQYKCESYKLLPLAAKNASRVHATCVTYTHNEVLSLYISELPHRLSWEHGLRVFGQNGLVIDGRPVKAGCTVDLQAINRESVNLDFHGSTIVVVLPDVYSSSAATRLKNLPASDQSLSSLDPEDDADNSSGNEQDGTDQQIPNSIDLEGHLITTIVFSARTTLPFGELADAAQQIYPESNSSLVKHILENGPFERVKILRGSIAKDHQVEPQYYYACEKDNDASRAATMRPFVKEIRTASRSRKTYFIPRWQNMR